MAELSDIKASQDFVRDLIARFKQQNISDEIGIAQAAWVHHRLRKVDCTGLTATLPIMGGISYPMPPTQVDVLNLAFSGDLELAYAVVDVMAPDDMTETYHFLTAARLNWLKQEIGKFLGWL